MIKGIEAGMDNTISKNTEQNNKSKINPGAWIGLLLLAALFAYIIFCAVGSSKLESAYKKAQSLMAEGDYKQAGAVLETIKEKSPFDTEALLLICEAHNSYNVGYIDWAHWRMQEALKWYKSSYYYTAPEGSEEFMQLLESEYDDYLAREREKKEQETEVKIKTGVPFVGMDESRIGDTILGKPSSTSTYYAWRKYLGKTERHKGNSYYFKKDGNIIFVAYCMFGIVEEVEDYRNDPWVPYTPKKGSTITYDNSSDDDSPSVDGFSSPEDFYDWYYDEFFDYYEAEDYYYSHGGY